MHPVRKKKTARPRAKEDLLECFTAFEGGMIDCMEQITERLDATGARVGQCEERWRQLKRQSFMQSCLVTVPSPAQVMAAITQGVRDQMLADGEKEDVPNAGAHYSMGALQAIEVKMGQDRMRGSLWAPSPRTGVEKRYNYQLKKDKGWVRIDHGVNTPTRGLFSSPEARPTPPNAPQGPPETSSGTPCTHLDHPTTSAPRSTLTLATASTPITSAAATALEIKSTPVTPKHAAKPAPSTTPGKSPIVLADPSQSWQPHDPPMTVADVRIMAQNLDASMSKLDAAIDQLAVGVEG